MGSGPVLFWCFSAVCFAFSAGETQVWLGDLRVVALVWLLVLCFASIDLLISRTVRPCTDVFTAYSHVRTEPLARHRPNSRKKNRHSQGCFLALETPEWTSRDSNHHRQSVSAGKTNAIPTEPSGRLKECFLHRGIADVCAPRLQTCSCKSKMRI